MTDRDCETACRAGRHHRATSSGWAESLQARIPGVVLGKFEEHIGSYCEDPAEMPTCPVEGGCVPNCSYPDQPPGDRDLFVTPRSFASIISGAYGIPLGF